VNFRLKISPLVATIFRIISGNETSNWGDWVAKDSKYVLGAQFCPVASQSIWNKHTNKQSYLSTLD